MSTSTYYIDALLTPSGWRWDSSSLTYGFMTVPPAYANSFEYPGFKALNSTQRSGVNRAVQEFEAVCNIDLHLVSNGNAATIRFGTAALDPNEAAHAYYPNPYYEQGGDVWFNNIPGADAYQQSAGSYGYMVTLHEIGHALGLKHSHERESGATTVLPYGEDNRRYTVMSYRDHPTASVEPSTLLLYDIAALQYLYGANMSTRVGNDTYAWARDAQFVSCIWDAGGTDTISAAAQTRAVTIDLRAGRYSSIGKYGSGSARNNLSIAYGAVIENAIGGSGNDRLIGNEGSNRLDGGGGSDTVVFSGARAGYLITKGGGQVVVTGGADGADTLVNVEYMAFADQTVTVNWAPVASALTYTPAHGIHAVDFGSLFSVVDSDGDAIVQFRVYDGTAGNGYFVLNGAPLDALRNHTILAAELPNLSYVTSAAGGDVLWVQAYDGYAWGAWKSFTANAMTNAVAVVSAGDLTPSKSTTFIAAVDLFSVADSDDLEMVRYRFYDGTAGNGRFTLATVQQVELANFEIDSADLPDFGFETSGTGSDTLWVQAYDGYAWSAWKSFTVAARANIAPVVSVVDLAPAKGTTFIAGADLFDVTDPDDANPVRYKFYDGTIGNGGFTIGGAPQIERTNLTVEHADLATIRYETSATGAGDVLWVQAFDGTAWSVWQSFTVAAPANIAPVVTVVDFAPGHGETVIQGEDLFDLTDPDDANTAVAYKFYDGTAGNGRFFLNGNPAAERLNIYVTAAELADFEYRTSVAGRDVLWVQAFDGTAWSAWKGFTAAAMPNAAPVVTVQNLTPALNQTAIAGEDLFDVSDADLDAITHYKFYDGTIGNGRLWLSGAQQVERSNIEITAADLANIEYRTSTDAGDTLWVQAYDGYSWSAWKSFTVAPRPAAMAGQSLNAMASQLAAASALAESTGGQGLLGAAFHGTTESISATLKLALVQT